MEAVKNEGSQQGNGASKGLGDCTEGVVESGFHGRSLVSGTLPPKSLATELDDISLTTLNAYRDPLRDELAPLHIARDYEGVLSFTKAHEFNTQEARSPYVASRLTALGPLVAKRKSLRFWLNIALLLTVGLIAVSVGALALTPKLAHICGIPGTLLVTGWLWLVLTFGVYTVLIKHTLA